MTPGKPPRGRYPDMYGQDDPNEGHARHVFQTRAMVITVVVILLLFALLGGTIAYAVFDS